ncbi:MAG: hypothetical protein LBF67_08480 [Prevotellaceae bacterium]|nr:hypothetical protein [Prevotellaceae bacterium]
MRALRTGIHDFLLILFPYGEAELGAANRSEAELGAALGSCRFLISAA